MVEEIRSRYKYIILIASIFLTLCLGSTYSWSVFVEPLRQLLNQTQARVQLPFTFFYIFFPITLLFSGFILNKIGIRNSTLLGILFFSLGWIGTGFFGTDIRLIVLFNGILGGIGVGLAYMVPIKACMQWFPKHKGLATGIAVAGFGGGSALLSHLARFLMETQNYPVLMVFRFFGFGFLIIGTGCALLMKSPPGENESKRQLVLIREIVKDPLFQLLFIGMLAGLAGGFAIISNLKQIFKEATPLMGATAVSLLAVFNALGRVVWGAIHDKQKGKWVITANLLSQALLLLLGAFYIRNENLFYLFAIIAGFNYGGVLVLYAAEGGKIWGPEQVPLVYGWIFFANVPASFSSVFAGYTFDKYGSFSPAFLFLSVYNNNDDLLLFQISRENSIPK